jgi:homoserine kinase
MFPAAPKLLAGMAESGALAVCWSGAGPALLGICRGTESGQVRSGAEAAMAEAGVTGTVLVLRPDLNGLILDRDGSGGLYDFNAGE